MTSAAIFFFYSLAPRSSYQTVLPINSRVCCSEGHYFQFPRKNKNDIAETVAYLHNPLKCFIG